MSQSENFIATLKKAQEFLTAKGYEILRRDLPWDVEFVCDEHNLTANFNAVANGKSYSYSQKMTWKSILSSMYPEPDLDSNRTVGYLREIRS